MACCFLLGFLLFGMNRKILAQVSSCPKIPNMPGVITAYRTLPLIMMMKWFNVTKPSNITRKQKYSQLCLPDDDLTLRAEILFSRV